MECVVTGVAGFIGSHLAERLIAEGHRVIGIDSFHPYYPRSIKERNLASLRNQARFTFHEIDLCHAALPALVTGAEWVFHLGAMAGLAASWSRFDQYHVGNIVATHRLLDALRDSDHLDRLVYVSTSSVYGRYATGDEALPLKPTSPYGVTKLAAEHLCRTYQDTYGIPVTCLRYFSVYGPRQRPDMGYHLFIDAILNGRPIPLTGDGRQTRGNTYVSDCVEATMQSVNTPSGETFNVGGGEIVSVEEVIREIEDIVGRKAYIERLPPRPGDQRHTGADCGKLARHVGWIPKVGVREGLERQVAWQQGEQGLRRAA